MVAQVRTNAVAATISCLISTGRASRDARTPCPGNIAQAKAVLWSSISLCTRCPEGISCCRWIFNTRSLVAHRLSSSWCVG